MEQIITWDLGATKCTAGLIEHHSETQNLICKKKYTIKLADTVSLEDMVMKLEKALDFSFSEASAICIGAAGHFDGKNLIHTNPYPYSMHFAQLAERQHWPWYAIIHDYASIVCATFTAYMQEPHNLKRINLCPMKPHTRRVALGIGTGLGMKDGVQFPNGDFWLGQNEIGHIGITHPPSADAFYLSRHHEIMQFLQNKYAKENAPISFERILSGQGMVNLYEFFYPNQEKLSPEELGLKLSQGQASEIIDAFAWYVGLCVGAVQLIFMPQGGVWITGGVSLNYLELFDRTDFLAGIYASPAYLMQRQEFPLGVLCNPEHALIGNAFYAVNRLLNAEKVVKRRQAKSYGLRANSFY
jgi:glucokinase